MKRYLPFVFLLIILEMIIYFPLLSSFFDPQEFMTFLVPLKGQAGFGEYLTGGWSWTQNDLTVGFFRPVTSLSFMAEYHLWGANPAGYRAVNMFIHLFVCLLTIPLGRRIGIVKFWWLPAVITVIHPGAIDALWFIAARNDVLATLFSVVALILTFYLLEGKLKGAQGIFPWIAVLLAIGSKELGMANFLALPVLVLFWPDSSPDRKALRYFRVSALVVLLAFVASRLMIFGNIGGYGDYTAPGRLPSHVYQMIVQSTGVIFIQNTPLRLILHGVLGLLSVSLLVTWRKQFRVIALLVALFFIYGFQSIIGEPCTHYIYVLIVFFSLITGLAVETGAFLNTRLDYRRRILFAVLLALLLHASLYRSSVLGEADTSRHIVYRAVSAHSDEIAACEHAAILLSGRDDPQVDELKNIQLYMEFLKPGNETVFRFVSDGSQIEPGEALIHWTDGELLVDTGHCSTRCSDPYPGEFSER
jgi:hypothetical protein